MNEMRLKLAIPLFVALAYAPAQVLAEPILSVDLAGFAVLGATTVTNVPTSTISGSVGAWNASDGSSTAITGLACGGAYVAGSSCTDPQVTGGTVEPGTALAMSAQADLTTARTNLGLLGPGTTLGADLAGLTLAPGVYTVPAGVSNLTGTLTLNGLGDADAFWLFQMPSTLITSPGSAVMVINTGSGAGVFWNVGSSATIDTTTSFEGNILALTAITVNHAATIGCGRALADNAAVTLNDNTIGTDCATGTWGAGSTGYSGGGLSFDTGANTVVDTGGNVVSVPGAAIPEPVTLALLGVGLGGIGFSRRKRA